MRWDVLVYNTPGDYTVYPYVVVLLAPLLTCALMGAFNGFLIAKGDMQPIIATLILMVCGRGIAQILTNGKQFTTKFSPFYQIGNGSFLFLPMPIIITIVIIVLMYLFVRKTAFGTFVRHLDNKSEALVLADAWGNIIDEVTYAQMVIFIVFAITGLLSGISGLIYSSRIMSNDSNNAGLNFEMDAILAVVIGGTSMTGGKFSLLGTVIGSIIIRTIVTLVYYFGIASEATMAFKALIIAVVIVLQSEPVRNYISK